MLFFTLKFHRYSTLNNSDQSKLDQNQAVVPQIRNIIRHQIICDDLNPGESISETRLAKKFNVSRQLIREALIPLDSEGFVEILPHRGTFVKRIDLTSLLNGRFVRESVEVDIVRMVAASADTSLTSELRSQLQEQRYCPSDSVEEFVALDIKFHNTLSEAAGMQRVWEFLELARSKTDRVRFIAVDEYPMHALIDQHQHIVDCIDGKNPAQAQSAMRTHLRDILGTLPQILELYPEYFDNAEILGEAYSMDEVTH